MIITCEWLLILIFMHGFSHTVVNPDYISENNPPDSANNRYSPRSVSDNSDNEQGSSSSSEQSFDGDVNYWAGQSQYSVYWIWLNGTLAVVNQLPRTEFLLNNKSAYSEFC